VCVCSLCDKMSFLGFGHLTRSQSRTVGFDMDTDTPASSSRAFPARPSIDGTINELMVERYVRLRGRTKKDKFQNIKDRAYKLTPTYHPQLLRDIGGVHLPNLWMRRPCTTTGRSNTRRPGIHCIHWSTGHIKTTSSMGTLTITSLIRIFSSRF
jgi:hypothetical protein